MSAGLLTGILAGRAYVELFVKSAQFVRDLTGAQAALRNFGISVAKMGLSLSAIGGAVLAPIARSLHTFTTLGSNLSDIAARTRIAAEDMMDFKLAIENTGGSFEQLEKIIHKTGLETQVLLARLNQIKTLPERLKDIALRRLVGSKNAAQIREMLKELDKSRETVSRLELGVTQEQLDKADALFDRMHELALKWQHVQFSVGAAAAPLMESLVGASTRLLIIYDRLVQKNDGLIRGLTIAASVVTAVGAGLAAMGMSTVLLGQGLKALGTGLAALRTVVRGIITLGATLGSFLLTPMGLAVAAIALLIGGFLLFTSTGRSVLARLGQMFGNFAATSKEAIGGIGDALAAGDLELAGKIAWTGLKAAAMEAVDAIADSMSSTFGDTIGDIGTRLIEGDFRGAWESVITYLKALWNKFVSFLVTTTTAVIGRVQKALAKGQKGVASTFLAMAADQGHGLVDELRRKVGSLIVGVDLAAEQRRADELNRALGLGKEDLLGQAIAAANQGIDAKTREWEEFLKSIDEAVTFQSRQAQEDLKNRLAGSAAHRDEVRDRLRNELEELRKQAENARKELDARKGKRGSDLPAIFEEAGTAATFSAAGAVALGFAAGRGGLQERLVRAAELTNRRLDVLRERLERIQDRIASLVPRAKA
jgi:hypothetical protein